MRHLLTYIQRLVAVLVAAMLACSLVPASALARTAAGDLGIRLEVPASAFVDQGDDTKAAEALLGIRLEVPRQAFTDDGDDTKAADGMLGIRLEVPSQAYVEPDGDDTRSTDGLLGIRLEVPKQAFVDPDDGSDVRAAEGLFGIRLEVPKQAFTDDGDDTKAADGLVGIRLEVPRQAYIEDGDGTRAASGLFGIRLQVTATHTVTFDANGGVGGASVPVLDGASVSEPDPVAATREGYRVEGWYLDAACTERYDFSQPVFGDFTLFAKWEGPDYERAAYQLHLLAADATIADDELGLTRVDDDADPRYEGEYKVGKGLDLPTPTRPGYEFAGWYASWTEEGGPAGDPVDFISRFAEGEQHFWAKWEPLPPPEGDYWTVTFDSRGGSAVEPQYIDTTTGGVAARPDDPTRNGYTFDGWYADSMCMRPFDFATPITADTTVYAGWKRDAGSPVTSYVVAFDTQGGSTVARQSVREGACAIRPSAPTKDGYNFVDWYVDADSAAAAGEAGVFDFATPITGDTVLYAGWKVKPKLTVTFDANGGQFDESGLDHIEIQVLEGSMVAPEDVPTNPKQSGWQFGGWYLPAEGDPEGDTGGSGDGSAGPGESGGSGAAGAAPGALLGEKWDPAAAIYADTTIYAKWDLRLDVTVPVGIGFAVDAGSGAVTAPEMGRYALKSRTVRPVGVEALAVQSEQSELEGFFELPAGALPEGALEADRLAAWKAALSATRLSLLADAPGAAKLTLPLAGDADGSAWRSAYALSETERAAYRLAAFSYAGAAFDPAWQGADPSERLPLELGLSIPTDKLQVRTDLDGERPITRLQVTVAAQA